MIYIFDIDGTLADCSHRLHFIQEKPAKWPEFFEACVRDKPIQDVIRICQILGRDNKVMLVTGRSDECEEATIDWLHLHFVPFTSLYMRSKGDHREDSIVKAELLANIAADWEEDLPIVGVFEDRKQVVEMYRAKGLIVFQVADGNF
jgi:hypothetical protein